ncbi:MAG: thermonuclease family protein [Pseudomonadota bacterium]
MAEDATTKDATNRVTIISPDGEVLEVVEGAGNPVAKWLKRLRLNRFMRRLTRWTPNAAVGAMGIAACCSALAVFNILYYVHGPIKYVGNHRVFQGQAVKVFSGDAIMIEGVSTTVRLWGVDAPQEEESGFDQSKEQLTKLVAHTELACQLIGEDSYTRFLARCFLPDGRDLNRIMIDKGLAREVFPHTKGFYTLSSLTAY